MSGRGRKVSKTATLLARTDKAIRVQLAADRDVWIPMSVVHDDSEIFGKSTDGTEQQPGDTGNVIVQEWWAEKNHLREVK